jgi:hypothetical protein
MARCLQSLFVFGRPGLIHRNQGWLASFYFPPAWRRYRSGTLRLAYLVSAALASAALFTGLVVAGPLYRPPPHIIGPLPGPLMPFCTAFFALEVIARTESNPASLSTPQLR